MELFDAKGCLSEEGLQALVGGQLDETQRLEAAEHLAYCDRCMDRYTALLTDDVLEQPPRSARGAVMGTIWTVSYTHLDVYKRQACALASLPLLSVTGAATPRACPSHCCS